LEETIEEMEGKHETSLLEAENAYRLELTEYKTGHKKHSLAVLEELTETREKLKEQEKQN
jgi:hypothetical protein